MSTFCHQMAVEDCSLTGLWSPADIRATGPLESVFGIISRSFPIQKGFGNVPSAPKLQQATTFTTELHPLLTAEQLSAVMVQTDTQHFTGFNVCYLSPSPHGHCMRQGCLYVCGYQSAPGPRGSVRAFDSSSPSVCLWFICDSQVGSLRHLLEPIPCS